MSPRRRLAFILLILLVAIVLLLLLGRCRREPAVASGPDPVPSAPPVSAAALPPAPPAPRPDEVLASATLTTPARVAAGAVFTAEWTGPDNAGDFLTIVRPDAAAATYGNYRETREGKALALTAPIEPGAWEVRYVTARSRTVLARWALEVTPVAATLAAPESAILGTTFAVTWQGPNNAGDFVCIVPADASDQQVGNYNDTAKGSPLPLTAPVDAGPAEIRYVTGQERRVLARRPIRILAPETSLQAGSEVTAGAKFSVEWQGPRNPADYLTIVPRGTPDGQYRNYVDTAKGSPAELTALIEPGPAEIRYMTGTGARVLARRPISIVAAVITLQAPARVPAGAPVTIEWSGPGHPGDYLTIVPRTLADGRYGNYADASKGSPLSIKAPAEVGAAEIRYMSGQGAKVLARRPITIAAP